MKHTNSHRIFQIVLWRSLGAQYWLFGPVILTIFNRFVWCVTEVRRKLIRRRRLATLVWLGVIWWVGRSGRIRVVFICARRNIFGRVRIGVFIIVLFALIGQVLKIETEYGFPMVHELERTCGEGKDAVYSTRLCPDSFTKEKPWPAQLMIFFPIFFYIFIESFEYSLLPLVAFLVIILIKFVSSFSRHFFKNTIAN